LSLLAISYSIKDQYELKTREMLRLQLLLLKICKQEALLRGPHPHSTQDYSGSFTTTTSLVVVPFSWSTARVTLS